MSPLLKPKFLLVSTKKMLLTTLKIGQKNRRNVGMYEAAWPLACHTGQNNSRKVAWMQLTGHQYTILSRDTAGKKVAWK